MPHDAPVEAAPPPGESEPEPKVAGQGALRALEAALLWVEGLSRKLLPDEWNPLLHSGAIANLSLLIATGTGVLLLLWYSPSLSQAHESMIALEASPLGHLVRALHRYSSDACMAFVLWHALRLFTSRRFTGARWLAWVTGLLGTGLLWLVGWLGYWLVWDQAAQLIAVGTAKALDVLPIFADPLSREFAANGTVNSLLFFIVFFIHMLVPLAIGVALWLHIARLQRPDWLTQAKPALAIIGLLLVLSAIAPPHAGPKAQLAFDPGRLTVDGWYALPLLVAGKVSAPWAFGGLSGGFALLLAVPWALARGKRKPATVVESRCNACNQCVIDCPYDAIRLVPRTDGRNFPARALVDPSVCLGCGICAGSCAGGGSTLPHFDMLTERARIERRLAARPGKPLVLVCHDALPKSFAVDEDSGDCPQLPGAVVVKVPCAGWVQAITVERALRSCPKVLVVGCSGHRFREGMTWTLERLAGKRHPELDREGDRARVTTVTADRTRPSTLAEAVAALVGPAAAKARRQPPKWTVALAAPVVLGLIWLGSSVPIRPAQRSTAALAVSLRHAGAIEEQCRMLTAEEKAKLPVHMRHDKECQRRRNPVRLELSVDGNKVLSRRYQPNGLWGDGAAAALEEVPLSEGPHRVEVKIGDSADESAFSFTEQRDVVLSAGERKVVVFDKVRGFHWFPEGV